MDFMKAIPSIRGLLLKNFFKHSGKKIRIGSRTRIANKKNIQLGENVIIQDNVQIIVGKNQSLKIGNKSKIGSYSIIKCDFSKEKTGFSCGENFGCGDFCFFGCAGGIKIGDNVIMGQSVRFHAQNHNYKEKSIPIREQGTTEVGITIGTDCWIGSGVTILDGVHIGNGCVLGANSLINKNVPDYSVVVGNPMKIITKR